MSSSPGQLGAQCPFAKNAAAGTACPVTGQMGIMSSSSSGGGGCTLTQGGMNLTFVTPARDRVPVKNVDTSLNYETLLALLATCGTTIPLYMDWADMRARSTQLKRYLEPQEVIGDSGIEDGDILYLEPLPGSVSAKHFTSFAETKTTAFTVLILPYVCPTPQAIDGVHFASTLAEVIAILSVRYNVNLSNYTVAIKMKGDDTYETPLTDMTEIVDSIVLHPADTLIFRCQTWTQRWTQRGHDAIQGLGQWVGGMLWKDSRD